MAVVVRDHAPSVDAERTVGLKVRPPDTAIHKGAIAMTTTISTRAGSPYRIGLVVVLALAAMVGALLVAGLVSGRDSSTTEAPASDTPSVQQEAPLFQDNGVGPGRPYRDAEIAEEGVPSTTNVGPGRPVKDAER